MDVTTESSAGSALPAGSAPYYLVRFSPQSLRSALGVLFAWFAEMEKLHGISDAGVARTRLQWWRDEIARVRRGDASHPLGREMQAHLAKRILADEALPRIMNATDSHLAAGVLHDEQALAGHLQGTWGELALLLQSMRDVDAAGNLRGCGAYFGAVEILRRLGGEIRQPRPRIPTGTVRRLQTAPVAGHAEIVKLLCDRAERLRPAEPPPRGMAKAMVRLGDARLKEIRRGGTAVLESEMDLTPIRLLWIVWSA